MVDRITRASPSARPRNQAQESDTGNLCQSWHKSARLAGAFGALFLQGADRKDYIVALHVELKNQLHLRELIGDAEIDRCGGAEEIHGFAASSHPGIDILE